MDCVSKGLRCLINHLEHRSDANIQIVVLAFTWPKAVREVAPLNWTQEHKSVWYGPPSKATGHAPRPVRDWPMPLSYHRPACRRARQLGLQASVQACTPTRTTGHCTGQRASPVGTFLNSAILYCFPNIYRLRVEMFRLFLSVHVYLWPLCTMKGFYGNWSARFWEIRKTDAHTHTQMRQLYIYRCYLVTTDVFPISF